MTLAATRAVHTLRIIVTEPAAEFLLEGVYTRYCEGPLKRSLDRFVVMLLVQSANVP